MTEKKIRVLVVDDSVFARRIVSDIIKSSSELSVVGMAINGVEALQKAEELKPDVITMDVEMPELDGLSTLKQLMVKNPIPVIMLSSLTREGAKETVEAFKYGAVDIMAKPHGSHSIGLSAMSNELIDKIIAASKANVLKLLPEIKLKPPVKPFVSNKSFSSSDFPIVIIASSTGGPRALRTLVPGLTTAGGVAYVVVQHIAAGFSAPLARDLNNITDLNVYEADEGDILKPGDMAFARAGVHSVFEKGNKIKLTTTPPLWGVRPSADITMASAVPVFGSRLIGVVLTGMGRDGANGVKLISDAGGIVLAEHESSCVIYGMPRVAIETGAVNVIAPLPLMAEAINATVIQYTDKKHNR